MLAYELYNELEKLIPRELSCDWDNDGYMCEGGREREVKHILLSLDATCAAVDKAVELGCDTIITHHPMIFKPIKRLCDPKLMKLVLNGINVMSFHTRLDIVDGGVNTELAELLRLKNVCLYGELARMGYISEDMDFETFAEFVKKKLGAPHLNIVKCRDDVGRVMVAGGDGKDFYADAVSSGAGTYITGSMSYNTLADAYDNPAKVNVIEAGHYFTEQPVLCALERMVGVLVPDARVTIFESNPVTVL